jgi:hypothetical protein
MNVAKEGDKPELKWCLIFREYEKPMVCNSTNAQLIAQFSGRTNSDNWGGLKIVAYDDPNIAFGGKLVGGIRVRAPKNRPAAAPVAAPALADSEEASDNDGFDGDDIPF